MNQSVAAGIKLVETTLTNCSKYCIISRNDINRVSHGAVRLYSDNTSARIDLV